MRSQEEAKRRWQKTVEHASTLTNLRNAVQVPPNGSICTSGLRSLCWKTFLLFRDIDQQRWSSNTKDSRAAYSSLRGHFMKYVEQPELLQVADPLNDDANSPWVTLRKDEELRQEILQDVDRCMPDEPYFRQESTRILMTDILFVYCKINEDIGYRQGMHEILAPVLWVIENDAIAKSKGEDSEDLMDEILSSEYIEHDSFTLFSLIMRTAKSFYELGEPEKQPSLSSPSPQIASPIEQRSKRIHEVLLARLDPELATHLTQIEILPQIFLIRWIRLLFGREFPFESLLPLWDVLFAQDPDLELIDYVCVAMLLRIRWQLLKADYSQALMLLLKYPAPDAENGPLTFVEDAYFLRNNMTPAWGAKVIKKYSGRTPDEGSADTRPTPAARLSSQFLERRRSPLPSPASFLKQQGGMEALLKGAARNLRDRGETLGVNQALRDAAAEVRKNMQGLSPSPSVSRTTSENQMWRIDDRRQPPPVAKALIALEARNRNLGELLSELTDSLYKIQKSDSKDAESNETMSAAIRQLGLIKDCLYDSKLPLSTIPLLRASHTGTDSRELRYKTERLKQDNRVDGTDDGVLVDRSSFDLENYDTEAAMRNEKQRLDSERLTNDLLPQVDVASVGQGDGLTSPAAAEAVPEATPSRPPRPAQIVPTRSSLAQSSFAWMLEPGEESHGKSMSPPKSTSPFGQSGKKVPIRHGREKSSFLFGDEPEIPLDDTAGGKKVDKDPLS